MPFLSRRSVDPLTFTTPLRDRRFAQNQSELSQTPRSRARSEASLFRRVSTLFTGRRRTSPSQTTSRPVGIGYSYTYPRTTLPRVSSDSTPQSSLEIRRPSGLGRRASLLGSNDSTDNESFGREVQEGGDSVPIGFASLPNLLSGAFQSPERSSPHLGLPPKRRTASITLPNPIFRVVLEFLPRNDLPAVALVSRGFCAIARYTLYHSLNVQTMTESSLERLYNVLACRKELAALVVSFYCRSWPSWGFASPDGFLSSVPSSDVRQALQNMYNLKSLTLPSFASILSLTPSLTFSLIHLTILDKKLTQSQLVALRSWLATQASLESLSLPHLVEYSSTDLLQTNDHGSLTTLLPGLKSLRASTEIVSMLCLEMNKPIQHLTLDVHETLYTGLRPSSVIRPLNGVREMHIIFAPEVDKRTVEKFLGITGSMLTGEQKPEAMKSLEVEVLWTDNDAAEACPRQSSSILVSLLIFLVRLDTVRDCHLDHISFSGVGDAQIDVAISLHPSIHPRQLATTPTSQSRSLTFLDGVLAGPPIDIHCHSL
ncbi:hypothetical protein J3R82DRAFT_7886 [Butyriboletus roseoflavus]|nr:hypothetical protein J3R82DRAFT_7886 [Butyriboletus roseoflavus]